MYKRGYTSQENEDTPATSKKNYNRRANYDKPNNSNGKFEVIMIKPAYIVVKDENGCGIRKYGSFPDVKVGDFINI